MLVQGVARTTRIGVRASRHRWVHGACADAVLGWCWLPIALSVRALESRLGTLHGLIGIIFLVSFAHQPLTLGLVYGDPAQRGAHRRLYTWAPLVAAAAIVVGLNVSLVLVALMAGLWNAEHTLMQRYGVLRIYGRKVGDRHGPLEKPMLIAWLVVGISYLGAYVDLDHFVRTLGLGGTNERAVQLLDHLHLPALVLFWTAVAIAVTLTVRWCRAELALGAAASRPKHLYALATLGLVVMVMVDPIAGIAGYIAAHSIEYFAIVHSSLCKRSDGSPIALATSSPRRRVTAYLAYFAVIAAVVYVTLGIWDGRAYAFAVLFLGALHILYDGFVWKLRRPAVAASLGIPANG